MFQMNERVLITDKGTIQFPQFLYKAVEIGEIIVVVLTKRTQPDDNNNVFGVKDGRIVWCIQDQAEFNPQINGVAFFRFRPYSDIRIYEKDQTLLIATDASGFRFLVDPATGKIVGTESWVK